MIEPIQIPKAKPPETSSAGEWLKTILVIAGCGVLLAGVFWLTKSDDIQTDPTDTPAIVEQCTIDYVEALAEVNEILADEVQAGTIKSRDQLSKRSIELSTAARLKAFQRQFEQDNAALPTGPWDSGDSVDAATKHLRAVATGHRRAIR